MHETIELSSLTPQERYRILASTIIPRPIALVTSRDSDGNANAAPFSFFNTLCHDPPILALGIETKPGGDRKDTVRNLRATEGFVINLVSEEMATRMNVCAIDFPSDVDELDRAGFTAVPSTAISVPRIAESPVSFECRLFAEFRLGRKGENSIVMGEALCTHIRQNCLLLDGKVDTKRLRLIGRLVGPDYVALSDRFEMPRIGREDWKRRD